MDSFPNFAVPTYPPKDQSAHNSNKIMDTKVQLNSFDASDSGVKRTQESGEMDYRQVLPIVNKNGMNLVDARKLHDALGAKRDFSTWIKDRINKYCFTEGEDFVIAEYDYLGNLLEIRHHKNGESDNQVVAKRDYFFTIDSSKEICMIENNDTGRIIRRYFIRCEKELKKLSPKNYAEALRALADEVEKKEQAERLAYEANMKALAEYRRAEQEKKEKETAIKTIEQNQHKVDFADTFVEPDKNDMLIREVAKSLEQNGIFIAEKNLRLFLIDIHFFTKNSGIGHYELMSDVVKNGHGHYRSYYIDTYTGERINQKTIYMTGKGYKRLVERIKEKNKDLFLKYGKFI